MLRLTTKLTVKSKLVLKCDKHLRYNPEKDGQGGIRGGCARCRLLFLVYSTRQAMLQAVRNFEYESKPFETVKPRSSRPVPVVDPSLPPQIKPVKIDQKEVKARNTEGYKALRQGDHKESQTEGWMRVIKEMGEEK